MYKYQDADIKENYNILDVNRMDKKQLYTCLNRTTKFEYIHVNNQKLNRKCVPRLQPKLELMNSHFNSDFLYGEIYEVTFENSDKIYVGLTCEKLDIRLKCHATNKTSQVYKNRKYIPKIKLIVKAPSKDRKPLEKVENEWIHEYATKYGDKLLNIKSNSNLKRKEVNSRSVWK